MRKKIALVLILCVVVGVWLAPEHGPIAEQKYIGDNETHLTENVIVYKPWKEDEIIQEIQDRKKLLNEVPNTMTVHLYYVCKHHEYKTITITYDSPGSRTDPGYFLTKPEYI